MDRRQFLTASGTASVAVLAGCLTEDDDPAETPGEESDVTLPEDTETVLDAIPEAVDETPLHQLWIVRPQADTESQAPAAGFTDGIEEEIGVGADSIDLIGAGYVNDFERTVGVMTGSFTADEVSDSSEAALYKQDGFLIAASDDQKPWEAGLTAARAAADDPDAGLISSPVRRVVEPLADDRFVTANFDPQEGVTTGEVDESIEMIAFSQSLVDETTETVRYSVLFESESAVSESAVEDAIAVGTQKPDSEEIEYRQDGRQLIAEFTRELPPYRLPDDAPDVRFTLEEEGSVLVQNGSEPVSPANLDLRVDGESVDPPWGTREEPIEPDERFDVDFEPFSFVAVYWLDPEREGVEQPLGREIVGGDDAFEGEYDEAADELTVTYTGEPTVEADRFEVIESSGLAAGSGDETPLAEFVGETLTTGDSFVVSEIGYGGSIRISVSVEKDSLGTGQQVFFFRASPPGEFEFEFSDGQLTVTYRGESRSADKYVLSREDEQTETQFADQYDELTDGDSIQLAAELGEQIRVEWAGSEEPVLMRWETVTPDVEFTFEYDAEASELKITHDGEEPVAADKLGIRIFPEVEFNSSWAEEYETVSEGDSLVVDLDEKPDSVSVTFDGNSLDWAALEE